MGFKDEQDRLEAYAHGGIDIEQMTLLDDEHGFETGTKPTLPEPNATSLAVRDYLVRLLQSHGLGIDYSRRIAARWTVGSGRELRDYPLNMYVTIFGPEEDGWIIYSAVKTACRREKTEGDPSVSVKLGLCSASIVATCALGFITGSVLTGGWQGLAWVVVGFAAFLCFGFTVWVADSKDPEEEVAKELRERWPQKPAGRVTTFRPTTAAAAAAAAAPTTISAPSSSGNEPPPPAAVPT